MVILGLGCNLGDRLANLRLTYSKIKQIPNLQVKQVSPIYISDALVPEGAPASWDIPYLNLALRCETTLEPKELLRLTKQIEKEVGRIPGKDWGPRIIDIDLLAWDDLVLYDEQLHIPHEHLHERPFALWPLADVAPRWIYPLPGPNQGKSAAEMVFHWGSRFSGEAPLHTRQIQHRIDTPKIVGIVNITPDSFSDGGKFTNIEKTLSHVKHLVENGAEIIDIGAEATGPHAVSLDAANEWARLEPVLQAILAETKHLILQPLISIDTRHPPVAKKALDLKVDWINDVSGLTDPMMQEIVASTTCDIVVMHNLGVPVSKSSMLSNKQDPTLLVYRWMEEHLNCLEKNGITRDRVIFDVGIGYGKTAEQSLELLKNISCFQDLKTKLLVGHSRKSFLQQFTPQPANERDLETLILSLSLANQNVDYLRIHNVELHARAFKVGAAIKLI